MRTSFGMTGAPTFISSNGDMILDILKSEGAGHVASYGRTLGKDLAVRLPGEVVRAIGIADGEQVEIDARNGDIVIRRAATGAEPTPWRLPKKSSPNPRTIALATLQFAS